MCGVTGCREVFRTFSAFNSHIYHNHRAEVGIIPFGEDRDLSQNELSCESTSDIIDTSYSRNIEDPTAAQDEMVYEFPSAHNEIPHCQDSASTATFDCSVCGDYVGSAPQSRFTTD